MPKRVVTFSLSEDMCRYKKHMLKMVPVEKKNGLTIFCGKIRTLGRNQRSHPLSHFLWLLTSLGGTNSLRSR